MKGLMIVMMNCLIFTKKKKNESCGIRFANEKEIKQDHRLFDEQHYEKEYT